MIHQRPFFLLASAAVVSLSLGQAIAEEAPAGAPAAAAAPAEAAQASSEPAAAATESAAAEATASQASDDPAAAARAEMEKRYEEAMAARNARYEELRKQAAEVGLELPESPPWERAPSMGRGMMPPMRPGMMRPGMMGPGMPGPGMTTDDAAAGEETGAETEQAITPEDWMAQREQRWEEMRARAAEQGMELPETPPWEAAQQRRKEMLERYNAYRATIEAMTDEQKEAISALFGSGMAGSGCRQPMRARSGYPDYGYGGGPGMWRQPPQMPEMPQMPALRKCPPCRKHPRARPRPQRPIDPTRSSQARCRERPCPPGGDPPSGAPPLPSIPGGPMKLVRNLLALVGLLAISALIVGAIMLGPKLSRFDPEFLSAYGAFADKLLATGDPGVAMMWAVPVNEGLSTDDVIDSLKSLATTNNLLFVGESPFYKQVEAVTGEDYRYVNFLSFCDARVGKMMLEYRDQYSGFMPCRVALVEKEDGSLWLYSMNLDLMIHGGLELPPELKSEALRVRDTLQRIMKGAAAGEF